MARQSRRDQTKRATRRALLEAGLAEIVERGVDGPSLDAICARAGFTRGAFYVHFANREDFLVQLLDWVFSSFLEQMTSAATGEGTLSDVVVRFMAALERDELPLSRLGARFPQLLEASYRLPQVRERIRGILLEAIERVSKRALEDQQRGRARTDLAAESQASFLVAAALGAMVLRDVGVPLDLSPLRGDVLRLLEP